VGTREKEDEKKGKEKREKRKERRGGERRVCRDTLHPKLRIISLNALDVQLDSNRERFPHHNQVPTPTSNFVESSIAQPMTIYLHPHQSVLLVISGMCVLEGRSDQGPLLSILSLYSSHWLTLPPHTPPSKRTSGRAL